MKIPKRHRPYYEAAAFDAVRQFVASRKQNVLGTLGFELDELLEFKSLHYNRDQLVDEQFIIEAVEFGGGSAHVDRYAGAWFSIEEPDLFLENLNLRLTDHDAYRSTREFGSRWVIRAISNLNAETGVDSESEAQGKADRDKNLSDYWEPIQIEPSDEKQAALDATHEALEKLKADNGWAAEHEIERNEVVSALSSGLDHLKAYAAISPAYFKHFIWEPLERAGKRFGHSVAGVAVSAAKESLKAAFKRIFDHWIPF